MRTLLLLRHGQAAPEQGNHDRERPLTERGRRDADGVGRWLASEGLLPEQILSSSALRTGETARRVAVAAKFVGSIALLDELYLGEPEAYIEAAARLARGAERLLIVGHNPSLEALALTWSGQPTSLPTAALLVCSLPIANFSELSAEVCGKISRFVLPTA